MPQLGVAVSSASSDCGPWSRAQVCKSLSEFVGLPVVHSDAEEASAKRERRRTRREEIETLRAEAMQLETELAALQTAVRQKSVVQAVRPGRAADDAWKNMTLRQLRRRRLTEAENRKLKGIMEEVQRKADELERSIAEYAQSRAWASFHVVPSVWPGGSSTREPREVQSLVRSLDVMASQTTTIFSDRRMARPCIEFRDLMTDVEGTDVRGVQLLDSRLIPFGVNDVANALTRIVAQEYDAQWEQVDANTYQASFRTQLEAGSVASQVHAEIAMRRVDEPNRVTVLRSSEFWSTDSKSIWRVPVRHHLWMVVSKPRGAEFVATKEVMAQLQTCSMCVPTEGAPTEPRRSLIDVCTEISNARLDQALDGIDAELLGRRSTHQGSSISQVV